LGPSVTRNRRSAKGMVPTRVAGSVGQVANLPPPGRLPTCPTDPASVHPGEAYLWLFQSREQGMCTPSPRVPLEGELLGPRLPMARNRRGVRRWMRAASGGAHVGVRPRGWRGATPRPCLAPVRPVRPMRSMRPVRSVRWLRLVSPTACPTEPNATRGARLRGKRPGGLRPGPGAASAAAFPSVVLTPGPRPSRRGPRWLPAQGRSIAPTDGNARPRPPSTQLPDEPRLPPKRPW
jgi:hypothetical protein